jgi:DNA primase large subunit
MLKKIAAVTFVSLVFSSFQVHAMDSSLTQQTESQLIVEEPSEVVFMSDSELAEVDGAVKFKRIVKVVKFFKNAATKTIEFAREINENLKDGQGLIRN